MNIPVQGGHITAVEPRSLAAQLRVKEGDILEGVNGQIVQDVIDVQFYAAEYEVELRLWRDGSLLTVQGQRREGQSLGLSFLHPTFDVDIRRCNNLCEFCFVLQMPSRMRRTLYIKDDDYRYSFLFGHFVTLTNLSEHDEWRIVNQHLSPLYVSVHATDLEVRRQCLRNESAPDIVEQLRWLSDEGIEVHTQIVITPDLNDGAHLEQTVQKLASFYPAVKSVSVVPVGLTKQHKYGLRPHTRSEAENVLQQCHQWQEHYRTQLGANFVYPTDEWYLVTEQPIPEVDEIDGLDLFANGLGMVRNFIADWDACKGELGKLPAVQNLTLATATLFAPTLTKYAEEFATLSRVSVNVIPISNTRLGSTITVAGLLMGDDAITQLADSTLGEVIVLPRLMFDHPDGIALDDVSPMDIARALQRPVALADVMGDLIDIVYGRPALYFDPEKGSSGDPGSIQQNGGWAVEKYL
jgi:putative radical SAM enzyme (TIGR03279 family)